MVRRFSAILTATLVALAVLAAPVTLWSSRPAQAATPGDIFVIEPSIGVIRVDPSTGAQSIVSSDRNFASPRRLAVMANGDLIVTDLECCGGNQGGLIRVNPTTGAQSILASGGLFKQPVDVAIAPALSPMAA